MDPRSPVKPDPRRGLLRVDQLVALVREHSPELPLWSVTEGARTALARERQRLGESPDGPASQPQGPDLVVDASQRAAELARVRPRRVVNATGIVLHTNLGRAPLAKGAAEAAMYAGLDYGDLELDLATGQRGNRLQSVNHKLGLLSGAEAALVVNNNAAALMLALDTLARGREVIVSRGELVEIGGSFRIPDIMERAGVTLVEVGTTNRTRIEDYERAIGPNTGLLLKVHRSNFEVRGFVAESALSELVALGRERGIPVVDDLGSGSLVDLTSRGFPSEVYAPSRLAAGPDVLCFSGDKLLGGPQAGLILGSERAVKAMSKNPLARALRLDKMSLAALDWTLAAYLDGRAEQEIPALRQMLATSEDLRTRAADLAKRLEGATGLPRMTAENSGEGPGVTVKPAQSFVGGGSLPGFELESWVVTVRPRGATARRVAEQLRRSETPVLVRVHDEALWIDVRTLSEQDESDLLDGLHQALRRSAPDPAENR
ncbi:L-seryl-tRNA(Sec) selenium transferase [Myxococcota bacterium]|nr:L-seryl-tRNA(Sec) selenium transferase [Myxococcota bacterium]